MINESYYWKIELYKSFIILAKFRHLLRKSEQSFIKAEKALMIGAYIIRKLDEAQKIPPDFLRRREVLEFSISKGTIVDHMNWHRIETHYDLETIRNAKKDWKFIINQIIHSFYFIFSFDKFDKPEGILINSDKTKKEALFFLPLATILTMFLTISEGDITSVDYYRQRIGSDSNGKHVFGEMKLTNAIYSYPNNLDINKSIVGTMNGKIYLRPKDEYSK